MQISEDLKDSLKIGNSISADIFKKLIENCFSVLTKNAELYNITTLYNSKPDVIKQVYAALLTVIAEFARNDLTNDQVSNFLTSDCSYQTNKANVAADLYTKHKQDLQIVLGNIGSHSPHITDASWKIDYIIKTSNLDEADGPIFRVTLVTDVNDQESGKTKKEYVSFSCTSQEMQDLVYKLKDAVRHCQRLAAEH